MPRVTGYELEDSDPHCRWPPGAAELIESAPWRRIVVLGDSVAAGIREPLAGYRDLDGVGRVAQALRAAHWSFRYRNLGVRDLRLAEIRDTQLCPALEFEPDLVIVAGGGNDAMKRTFDETRTRHELTSTVAPLVAHGAQLITVGLFDLARSGHVPQPYAASMADRFDPLDSLTALVAAEHFGVHTANHRHPLAADPSIFASDRVHANARGHAIAAATLVEALLKLPEPSGSE